MYVCIVIPGQTGLSGGRKRVESESGTKSVSSIPAWSLLSFMTQLPSI